MALAIGEYHIGLRVDSDAAATCVRAAFGDAVVDDPAVAADYSIVLALGESEQSTRAVPRLLHGERVVLRSRSRRRILRALAAHLGVHAREDRTDVLELGAATLLRDGRAVLAPREVIHGIAGHERRLTAAGIAIVDGPFALLSAAGSQVMVEAPLETFDAAAAAEVLASAEPAGGERIAEPLVPSPGGYPLVGLAIGNFPLDPDVSTPARRVLAMLSLARNFDAFGGQPGLELLAPLATRTPMVVVDQARPSAGLRPTIDLFGSAGS